MIAGGLPLLRNCEVKPMIGLLKPAPHAQPLPTSMIDPEYRRLRRQVFLGIFVGYAAYYLVRNGVFITMVVCCLLTIVFSASTLAHKAESEVRAAR